MLIQEKAQKALQATTVSCAGVRGTTTRTSCVLPIATTTIPRTGTTTLVFVSPARIMVDLFSTVSAGYASRSTVPYSFSVPPFGLRLPSRPNTIRLPRLLKIFKGLGANFAILQTSMYFLCLFATILTFHERHPKLF